MHVLSWREVDFSGVVFAGLIAGYVMAMAGLWAGSVPGLAAVDIADFGRRYMASDRPSAWLLGLAEDVLYGSLLGQNALILTLITFLVLSLHQRLRMFPMWQQSLVLMVVFGLAQLVQLWLNALTGNRPPTLAFVLPALVSALLWPWVCTLLRAVHRRMRVN